MFKFFNKWNQKQLSKAGEPGVSVNGLTSLFNRNVDRRATSQQLVDLWHSWVYIACSRIGQRVGTATLRLYAVQGAADDTILVPHKRLSSAEVKALMERNPSLKNDTRLRTTESVVEILDHPFLKLIKQPNPWTSQYELFNESTQFSEATGDMYWYIPKDALGRPLNIVLLRTQWMKPIVGTGKEWIKEYQYGRGSNPTIFTPDEILHIRLPNLDNQYIGRSRSEGVMASVQLNDEAKAYNLALNRNNAIPSMIVSMTDANANEENALLLTAKLKKLAGGIMKQGGILTHSSELKIEKLASPIKDMQYIEGLKFVRVEILASHGVPEGIIYAENVNKSNAGESNEIFEKFTVKPKLLTYEDKLNANVLPLYGDESLFCAFDENVPRNEEMELKKTDSMWNTSRITRNEARARDGYPPLAGPEGEEFIIIGGMGMGNAGDDEETETEEEEEETEIGAN